MFETVRPWAYACRFEFCISVIRVCLGFRYSYLVFGSFLPEGKKSRPP